MATSVIIRDVEGYVAPAAPAAPRDQSMNSSGEYYMLLSSGEHEQKNTPASGPTLEDKLVTWLQVWQCSEFG